MYGADQVFPPQGFGGAPAPFQAGPRGGRGAGGPMGRGRGMARGGNRGGFGGAPDFYGGGPPADFYGGAGFEQSPLDAEVEIVLNEMHTEVATLDAAGEYGEQFKNARRLLTTEIDRLENNIDPEWLEVDVEKPIKLIRKVLIPTFRNPRFNYVGKVLGPKGTTLQNIAKHFKCHVYILGRGSTRDRNKEEELLNSGDPNYAHYAGPLHVKIETNAPPALAYQRVSGVLEVLQQLLQPVKDTFIPGITNPPEESGGEEKKNGDEEGGENGGSEEKSGDAGGENAEGGEQYGQRKPPATGSNRAALGGRGGGFRGGGNRGFQARGSFGGGGQRGGFQGGQQRGGFIARGRGGGGPMRGGPMRGRPSGFAPY